MHQNNLGTQELIHLRKLCKALCDDFIGRDDVGHGAVVVLLVSEEVEISGAGESEEDGLFLACLLAFERFIDGYTDGMAALWRRKDAFDTCKTGGCLKDCGLLHCPCLHISVGIQL